MADRDSPIAGVESAPPPDAAPPIRRPLIERMGTPGAAGIGVLLTLLGLIVLAWAVLYITKGRFLRHPFENIVSSMTHREVRVAGDFQLYFDPIDVHFVSEGLTVSNPEWAEAEHFFRADRIDTHLDTFTLLGNHRRVEELLLRNGSVYLAWDAAHRRNTWTFSEEKGEPLTLPVIRRAIVAGTRLVYRDPRMQLAADVRFRTIEAKDTEFASAIRFDGTGNARRTPFTLEGALLTPNETVGGGRNRLALRARAAHTIADVTGTLAGATEIEGADLHADVRGRNLADIFMVVGIAVPDTRSYRLRSALTKAGTEWRFSGLRGQFGDSDIAGKLSIDTGAPRLRLAADLRTDTLDIIDVAPFIGYNPQRVAAEGKAGAVRTVAGRPRVLPDAKLRVDALRNFDAKVQYSVRRVRADNLPVSNIALGLDLDNRLLKLSPLTFDMARGHVTADISINARREPVFTDYDIRLSPTPMGLLLAGFGVEESGTSGTLKARVKMTGTGDTVHDSLSNANGRIAIILPKGSMWVRNAQLAELDIGTFIQKMFEDKLKEPVEINCGLIGFTVRDGVAAADPILIDTRKSVMVGRGGFSFKNESLDLAFRADSKKFSLFSGQSPVGVGGYFAAPSIDVISGDLLARAGAGLGLGLVASPVAAMLAFVDVGDAKAADCGPVLAGASAQAQRTSKGKPRDDVGKGTTATSESGEQSGGEEKKQRKKFLGIF